MWHDVVSLRFAKLACDMCLNIEAAIGPLGNITRLGMSYTLGRMLTSSRTFFTSIVAAVVSSKAAIKPATFLVRRHAAFVAGNESLATSPSWRRKGTALATIEA